MISVIIDNYNYGRFVGEAIESVINQSIADWELIVIDDGSKDNSREIIEEYRKRLPNKIRCIYKENGGQASCFNEGHKASQGDIIAFLDSDDLWKPDKLYKIRDAHKKSGYVGHEKEFSNGFRQIIHTEQSEKRSDYLKKYGINDSYDIITSTLSLSRELADKIFPMPVDEFRICADHYVKYLALYYENPVFIHEKLTDYRIHGDNGFVVQKQSLGSANIEEKLDYISVEYANQRLICDNPDAQLIPHKTFALRNEFWKECGEGFYIKPGEKYILYGTGEDSERFLRMVIELGGSLVAYCDSNETMWGQKKNTKSVLSPDELKGCREKYDKIIIASMFYFPQIVEMLSNMGFVRGRDYYYTPIF